MLLDIEGTISPISFVRDVLFPYSALRLREFVSAHRSDLNVSEILGDAAALSDGREPIDALVDWHAKDVKAPPLKKLQGLIWESGYRSGAIRSPVFADALAALRHWHAQGIPLFIYSSGSVQAQLLLFEFSEAGDLRPLFSGHFDTDIGPKVEASSYRTIAERIGTAPADIVFFSDHEKELAAARQAGLKPVHVLKDLAPSAPDFLEITSYDDIDVVRVGVNMDHTDERNGLNT